MWISLIPRRRKARRGPERSRKYLRWVSSLPCLICQTPGSDPAHTQHNGMASKGSDYSCVPLCRVHHREYDRGKKAFEEKYGVVMADVAAALVKIWKGGRA